jgi:hypothetical protein
LNATGGSENKYVDGMTTIFQRAAASPWFDTAAVSGFIGASNGVDYASLLAGLEAPNHPRVLNLIVTPDAASKNGTYEAPIVDVAPVYVERVYFDTSGNLRTVFRFLPPKFGASGGGAYLFD